MTNCRFCGVSNKPGVVYCGGHCCGSDLVGQPAADGRLGVQAWFEPGSVVSQPGLGVTARLVVRNAGGVPDLYTVTPLDDASAGMVVEGPVSDEPLFPGDTQEFTVRCQVPVDAAGTVAGAFDVELNVLPFSRFEVPVYVSSRTDPEAAAGAVLTVTAPAAPDLDHFRRRSRSSRGRPKALLAAASVVVVVALAFVGIALAGGDDKPEALKPTIANSLTMSDPAGASDVPAADAASAGPSDGKSPAPSKSSSTSPSAAPGVVPDVVGRQEADGAGALTRAGYIVRVVAGPAGPAPKGRILSTDPAAGSRAAKGSSITVRVSPGPAQPVLVPVPNVEGQTQQSASSELKAAGFTVSVQTRQSARPAGEVLAQNPAGGTQAATGSTVTITVATPSAGGDRVTVPSVTGLTVKDAREALRAAGLVMTTRDGAPYKDVYLVQSQSVDPGTSVARGSAVEIYASTLQPFLSTEQE